MALLDMVNIDKSFFGKAANHKVCLTVEPGEIHGLLGENGAGKTTLMNILYGIYTRDGGEVYWKGKPISFLSPKDAINCKIGMVHQHFMLVPTLTVSQNITLGLKTGKGRKAVNASIEEISAKYGMEVRPNELVSSLSVGEQQRVEIIKLLYRGAELLILDEPTAVLTPQETSNFFQVLRKLKESGCSVIIITHRIPEIMDITDRVTVLRDGKNAASAFTKDITEEELSRFMIGRPLHRVKRQQASAENKNGLRVEYLNLSIGAGEIVGVAGVEGNGQKDLAEAVLGIKDSAGKIFLGGKEISGLSVTERKNLGIGYISDDRHKDSLIMDMDLMDNMLLRGCPLTKYGLIDNPRLRENTQRAVDEYDVKTPGLTAPIRYLSGGNQQKLILAREIANAPKCVVAFQPTRGLDIGATEFIHQKLLELRSQGCSILVISSDLEEILALSDRIAVIYKSKLMDVLPNQEGMDLTEIGLLMAGRKGEAK